ncbi:type I-E CRISPR-associated protein Cas6/Cse3/CasE [Marinobacterium litorale]|uniref:type I-E CRISPR-associated protein Cas6/Cse3/CasE n=1 Tax=Marinobacterium litorale TaxID=404770 RepID=UPI00040B581D|nr:type I-E CRISPR-associated protein Cas6/Cse3/CasE [Marinobacterium litorale]
MFLSRVSLQHTPEGRKALLESAQKGVYGQHQLLWRLFAGDERRQFLFREEQGDGRIVARGEPYFYLLSPQQPQDDSGLFHIESRAFQPRLSIEQKLDFRIRLNPTVCRQGRRHDVVMDAQRQWLQAECGRLDLSTEGTKKQIKSRLLDMAGDVEVARWRELIAEGVYRDESERRLGRTETLNLALKSCSDSAVRQWWQSRCEEYGIGVEPGTVEINGYQQQLMPGKGSGAAFSCLELSGTLRVTQPETFMSQLHKGFGRAKGFGCGLMMIKPA